MRFYSKKVCLFFSLTLLYSNISFSDPITPLVPPSSTHTSETLENRKSLDTTGSKPPAKQSFFEGGEVIGPTMVPLKNSYFYPGILVYRKGKWEGNDYLFNLNSDLAVYVSILKPEGESLAIVDTQIQREIEALLQKEGIKTNVMVEKTQPPLPIFEMQILIYPVTKGYVASCAGRLFESVKLDRVKLQNGMAFQAITWEKDSLIVGPKEKFTEQLNHNIKEIVTSFLDRYKAYQKAQQEEDEE